MSDAEARIPPVSEGLRNKAKLARERRTKLIREKHEDGSVIARLERVEQLLNRILDLQDQLKPLGKKIDELNGELDDRARRLSLLSQQRPSELDEREKLNDSMQRLLDEQSAALSRMEGLLKTTDRKLDLTEQHYADLDRLLAAAEIESATLLN